MALVQGESLLNDATSLVLFQVSVGAVVAATPVSLAHVSGQFLLLAFGGAAFGVGSAFLVRQLRRRVHDPVLETVVALVTPYAVYVAAEEVHTSGVTAVVLAGLTFREHSGRLKASGATARLQISNVYAVLQFLLESVIFAVIGLELPTLIRRLVGSDQQFLLGSLLIVVVVIVVRALWIFPTSYLRRRLQRRSQRLAERGSAWQVPLVITWVGTRGVVPLAAALSIPLTISDGSPFPHRDLLLVITTICIIVTLVARARRSSTWWSGWA
jgi:CPA1 family monovalent cation:H+ antiporter